MPDNAAEPIRGYGEFELDLNRAVLEHLPPLLARLEHVPLTEYNVASLPEKAQGAYMLLYDGAPVYIGKTDANHGFRDRLLRHCKTVQHRRSLDAAKVSFKAVRIMVFTMVNVESTLIKHFLDQAPLSWQSSGFGSNDPGHEREFQEPAQFDLQFPVDIDRPLPSMESGRRTALEILQTLKRELPYDFRFETDLQPNGQRGNFRIGHSDQRATAVHIPHDCPTLRQVLSEILDVLPSGWIATVFPGRVILYKEPTQYKHAVERIAKRG